MSDSFSLIDAGSVATNEVDASLVPAAPTTAQEVLAPDLQAEAAASPKKGKVTVTVLTDSENTLLTSLGNLWTRRKTVHLEVRHEVGRLINAEIGDPTTRQERGAQVIEVLKNRLRISQPDLSRMRWFAHNFASVSDLVASHPKVKTWSQVKVLLPGLEGATRKAPASPIKKAVEGITMKVSQAPSITNEECKKLIEALRQFAKVMDDKLQIRLTVSRRKPALAAA